MDGSAPAIAAFTTSLWLMPTKAYADVFTASSDSTPQRQNLIADKLSDIYTGRFAPSPTGPLHLGSLFTALASYLEARYHQGRWLLRIDDLDTPRNMPGATEAILDCLHAFGLCWDGEVYYQSRHLNNYVEAIKQLQAQQLIYPCYCSRKQLSAYPGPYPGFCRDLPTQNGEHALRLKITDIHINFMDGLQGPISENMAIHGDFIVKRRDGIVAYQLAVVIDDHAQQVNQIVRGYDLLNATARQMYLQQLLGYPHPSYRHVPILVDQQGNKLSKQTFAEAVDPRQPAVTLCRLLNLLQQNPPPKLRTASVAEILAWAIAHWRPEPQKIVAVSSLKPEY